MNWGVRVKKKPVYCPPNLPLPHTGNQGQVLVGITGQEKSHRSYASYAKFRQCAQNEKKPSRIKFTDKDKELDQILLTPLGCFGLGGKDIG